MQIKSQPKSPSIETELTNILFFVVVASGSSCDGFLSKDPSAQRVVTLSDTRFVFLIFAVGLLAATVTLFVECAVRSLGRDSNRLQFVVRNFRVIMRQDRL